MKSTGSSVSTLAPAAVSAGTAAPTADGSALTVLYDGACPLCRREIGLYEDLAARQPQCALRFVDVNSAEETLPEGATRAQLLARFHVQQADGTLTSGARAFVALWAALPGWRWLARVARVPGVTPLLELTYRAFLLARPSMQRVARAFEPPTLHVPAALWGELRSDHAGETGAVWIYRGVLAALRLRRTFGRGGAPVDGAAGRDFANDAATTPASDALSDALSGASVAAFAQRHLATEQEHLRLIEPVVPWPRRSRLLVPWRAAGFVTGALPALAGPRAVYATIAAVETFVDRHYQQQIDTIDALPEAERASAQPLRALLERCRQDECEHRDEAVAALQAPPGALLRAWCTLVGRGSAAAVVLARRL